MQKNAQLPELDPHFVAPGTEDTLGAEQWLHPKLKKYTDARDPTFTAMAAAFAAYRNGFYATKRAVQANDPTMTEAAQFVANEQASQNRLSQAGKTSASATEVAQAEIRRVNAQIEQELGLDRDTPLGAEIRSHFKGLDAQERQSALIAAAEEGDKVTMAAVLTAPPMLSGTDAEALKVVRARYAELHCAELIDRREALELAVKTNQRANLDAIKAHDTMFPRAKLDAIRSQSRAAVEARSAI